MIWFVAFKVVIICILFSQYEKDFYLQFDFRGFVKLMGMTASGEAEGVNCYVCNLRLPKNDWEFTQFQNYYCFFSRNQQGSIISFSLTEQSSKIITVNKGTPVIKYFRPVGEDIRYKCAICFSQTQPKEALKALDFELQGKGIIAIPPEKESLMKLSESPMISLISFHNTRLRGHPSGYVDMTTNNENWEKWQMEYLDANRFYLKSSHGTYLRGFPDGRVDLSPNRMDWEIWTKVDNGGRRFWRSFHGTYLRAHPDGRVDLAPQPKQWEQWFE